MGIKLKMHKANEDLEYTLKSQEFVSYQYLIINLLLKNVKMHENTTKYSNYYLNLLKSMPSSCYCKYIVSYLPLQMLILFMIEMIYEWKFIAN